MKTIFKIKPFLLLGLFFLLLPTCKKKCSPTLIFKIGYYPGNTCGHLESEGCNSVSLKNMYYFSSGDLRGFDYEGCGETGSVEITYSNLGCVDKVEQHCSN